MDAAAALVMVETLSKKLDERAAQVRTWEDWYDGNHPVPDPPPNTLATVDTQARLAFVNMARTAVTNLLPPIVDVQADGLEVEGFRFGADAISADVEAQSTWQRSHMDADHKLLIHAALRTGQSFGLVWRGADGRATIDVEDPSQAIVAYEPGSRRMRRAGLKRWVDDDGYLYATLYTPDAIYKYRSTSSTTNGLYNAIGQPMAGGWVAREVPGETWPLANPLGVVPLVELRANQPLKASLYGGGRPEFLKQITPQKRMNAATMLLLTTMEAQSFRQRWATGWDYPTNDDGSPDKAAMIRMSASHIAAFRPEDEAKDVKVGEFAQADFRPFINVQGMWVKEIAATSGTPPYAFLLGDMINVASESLARIEGVKVSKMRNHARMLGEGLLEIELLALRAEGNPKGEDYTASIMWREFEERTATEQANLAAMAKALGAPLEAVYAMFPGVSQTEARRWVTQGLADQLRMAALLGPQTAPVAPDTPDLTLVNAV